MSIKNNGEQVMSNEGKAMATVALAIVCGILLKETGGEHGIGWFILGLLIIW